MTFTCSPCRHAGDAVPIEDLGLPARIGVYPSERGHEQAIDLSLEIGLPNPRPFHGDDVVHTIDYTAVVSTVTRLCVSRHFNLVQRLAEEISDVILDDFGGTWVGVRLCKVNIPPGVRFVGVSIVRRRGLVRWMRRTLIAATAASGGAQARGPMDAAAGSAEVRI